MLARHRTTCRRHDWVPWAWAWDDYHYRRCQTCGERQEFFGSWDWDHNRPMRFGGLLHRWPAYYALGQYPTTTLQVKARMRPLHALGRQDRTLCGASGPDVMATKSPGSVTCSTCLELLSHVTSG